jgi:ElaB/YqjD/DUF883 family membrane-anchored ribosome-binding protein
MATRRKKEMTLEERLEALRADLEALQGDMQGLAGGVGAIASERVSEMLKTTEDMADQITSQVEDWATDNVATLRETVREQPVLAIALAMSAGALLGAILLRR